MLSSTVLSFVLTVVFVVTGAYAVGRLAVLASGAAHHGDRLAELFHLLMSVAMVAMVWGLSGGPASPGGVLQIVLFSVFSAAFLSAVLRPARGHGRFRAGHHLLGAVAMVWMVAAMPLLMGTPAGSTSASEGHAGHGGAMHAGDASAVSPMASTPPARAVAVSVALAVLLAAAAVVWARRALRPVPAAQKATDGGGLLDVPASSRSAVATATAPTRPVTWPRTDAVCHLLMSLGMAAMLLAMT